MARIEVNGLELDYELIGPENGPPLVLTPGGRYPRDTAGVPELGQIFADNGYRVLLWDRPGCGASDIWSGWSRRLASRTSCSLAARPVRASR